MAERKATNKYYPPDWTPEQGSINTYHGQHPLRHRAKKLKTEGIMIIRFEIPFNIWCLHCNTMIGMGTRFNAEKKSVGEYFSTKILEFRMKCANCKNWFAMETDPKNSQYICTEGCKRKIETFHFAEDDFAVSFMDAEEKTKLHTDPMFQLEHQKLDELKGKAEIERLQKLVSISESQQLNDFLMNQKLRQQLRQQNKIDKEEKEAFKKRYGSVLEWNTQADKPLQYFEEEKELKLAKAQPEDETIAKQAVSSHIIQNAQTKKQQIRNKSIFGKQKLEKRTLHDQDNYLLEQQFILDQCVKRRKPSTVQVKKEEQWSEDELELIDQTSSQPSSSSLQSLLPQYDSENEI